jgi:hypothetical protein
MLPGNCGYAINHATDTNEEVSGAWYRLMLFDEDDHVMDLVVLSLLINQVSSFQLDGPAVPPLASSTFLKYPGNPTISTSIRLEFLASSPNLPVYVFPALWS